MDTQEKTYNGWANYATWNLALWVGNDGGAYNYVREAASNVGFKLTKRACQALAMEIFPNGTPDMDGPADMFDVDWDEIADCWNEE